MLRFFTSDKTIVSRLSMVLAIRHFRCLPLCRIPLKDKDSVNQLFTKSSWSVKDLISNNDTLVNQTEISNETVLKMLKLSGFETNVSAEKLDLIRASLKSQMVFINHLYDDKQVITKENSNDSMFRLVASDHIKQEPITLHSLLKDIEELPKQIDLEKAETGFDIKKLHDKHKSHFTVKLNNS